MQIITEPAIHVLSTPQVSVHPKYKLPIHTNQLENLIATAGKVCYDSYGPGGNPVASHIQNLVNSGHHSVIEHVHVGLFIEGVSRGLSHELVRHRMFNYSQRSTRYTEEGQAAIVLEPYYASIYENTDQSVTAGERLLLNRFLAQCERALAAYQDQVERLMHLNPHLLAKRDLRKWARGKARQLLPHALETRLVMTGNLRSWRHFLLMRTNRAAEAEIRRLAAKIAAELFAVAPNVYMDLVVEQDVDGFLEVTAA